MPLVLVNFFFNNQIINFTIFYTRQSVTMPDGYFLNKNKNNRNTKLM